MFPPGVIAQVVFIFYNPFNICKEERRKESHIKDSSCGQRMQHIDHILKTSFFFIHAFEKRIDRINFFFIYIYIHRFLLYNKRIDSLKTRLNYMSTFLFFFFFNISTYEKYIECCLKRIDLFLHRISECILDFHANMNADRNAEEQRESRWHMRSHELSYVISSIVYLIISFAYNHTNF